ncbi:hypothetical protein LWI29_019451 [Acer saccharum]|uniref:Uncharacterized protein n=1 Tax=Acer saccharum TaxID=4024 RepID=A0AA39SAU9_ACESA|nr:hypothetical protein LWI29_019451 [Acer saccharum]
MDALVRRYGRNELSDDESGSPFTNGVLRMPFPKRFRMPPLSCSRRYRSKRTVWRYRSAMAQYVHNDALLCLNFPQILGDLGSRWFGRLPAASISSFGELSKAFSRQFLGNVHRKKSVAQGYARRREEIATGGYFVHGGRPEGSKTKDQTKVPDTKGDKQKIKRDGRDGRRAYDSKIDQPQQRFQGRYPNYTPLKKDQEEVLAILEEKNMSKEPPKQSTYARRDTTKYCRFHKEMGMRHPSKDSRQDGRVRKLSPKKAEDEGAINTIFGGLATGKSNRERTQEIREAMEVRRDLDVNSIEPDPKRIKEGWDPIIFTEADSHGVDVRPNDALVISARIGHREVH